MLETFIYDIKELHKTIENNGDGIHQFLDRWEISGSIGDKYQQLSKSEQKKDTGSFYTPKEIVSYMVGDSLKELCYAQNPFVKILDPSCGGGFFLSEVSIELVKLAQSIGIENPEEHVIRHNLYGCDTDEIAVLITRIELFRISGILSENILQQDFLIAYDGAFDLIIGNPPYMGHKVLVGEYRKELYQRYADVFYDKGDFSYCFIRRSIDLLKPEGRLIFLTSRYIVEALNGAGIRKFLLQNGQIQQILDFYGVRFIKEAKVDNIILKFLKTTAIGRTKLLRLSSEAEHQGSKVLQGLENEGNAYVRISEVRQSELTESGFVFLNQNEKAIISKITRTGILLSEICSSHQGIITGCDNAFVVSKEDTSTIATLHRELLLNWIKGRQIQAFQVEEAKELLIYTNMVKPGEEEKYEDTLQYVQRYKERLQARRECLKGTRRWFDLQWGRELCMFQQEKIIFPYKSATNRFAVDKGNCFSADVYALKLISGGTGEMSHQALCMLLNSSLYEFYLKSIAKKLGKDLYEYYPNKIMTLFVPKHMEQLERLAQSCSKPELVVVDKVVNEYFGISTQEMQMIQNWCGLSQK